MTTTITVNQVGDTSLTVTVDEHVVTITQAQDTQTLVVENNATAIIAGLPAGGLEDQKLVKRSNSDFDAEWADDPAANNQSRISHLEYRASDLEAADVGHDAELALLLDMHGAHLVSGAGNVTVSAADSIHSAYVVTGATSNRTVTFTTNDHMPSMFGVVNSSSYTLSVAFTSGEATVSGAIPANAMGIIAFLSGVGFVITYTSKTDTATQYNYTQLLTSHGAYNLQQGARVYTDQEVATVNARVSQAEYDIADLEGRASTIEYDRDQDRQLLAEIDADLTTAEGSISALQGDVSSLQGRVSHNEYSIDETRDSIDELTSALQNGFGSILDHDNRISHLEYSVDELMDTDRDYSDTLSSHGARITNTESRVSHAEYSIDELRDSLTTANDAIVGAFQSLNDLNGRISVSEYDIAEDRDTLAEHASDISSLEGRATSLEGRASVTEYDVEEIRDVLNEFSQVYVGTDAPTDTRKLWVDTDDTATDVLWKDLVADISRANASGAGAPTWAVLVSGLYAYRFSATATNEIWLTLHVPHDIKPNTRMIPHVHWCPSGTNTGNCRWGFEYSYAKRDSTPNRVFAASTTVYITQAGSGVALAHQIAEIADPDTDGILVTEPDGIILVRVFRDGANAADTLTDTAFLVSCDLHYQSDREGTPSRDPGYY